MSALRNLPPLALLLVGCATGCADRQVEDLRLGGVVPIPAVTEVPTPPLDDKPSVEGVTRENWADQVVLVPVDEPVRPPGFAWNAGFHDPDRRQRGAYPTPDSAVEPARPSADQALRDLSNPFYAAAGLVTLPVRLVTGPWAPSAGKHLDDWRERASSGPERPDTEPPAKP